MLNKGKFYFDCSEIGFMKCVSLVFSIVANWLKQAKTTKMKIYELMKCFISVFTRLNLVLLKVKQDEMKGRTLQYDNILVKGNCLSRKSALENNSSWNFRKQLLWVHEKKTSLKKSTCQTYKNPFWFWHWISTGLFDQVTLLLQYILGSGYAGCTWVRLCRLCLGQAMQVVLGIGYTSCVNS